MYVTTSQLRVELLCHVHEQIWGPFRHENYARHKLIGKFAMGSLMGTYVTASVIAMGHLSSNEWAEKVSIALLVDYN